MRTQILILATAVSAAAQTPRGVVETRPDFLPSYQVHISPSGTTQPSTSMVAQGNYWISRGYDLRNILAEVYAMDRSRVELPARLDDGKRYDFVMVLPGPESEESIHSYVRQAIQDEFHVRVGVESEFQDVYVATLPNGPGPAVKVAPKGDGGVQGSGLTMTDASVSARGIDMAELCRVLERLLGRLIVNETHIPDRFDVEAKGNGRGRDALLAVLREQLGLVLSPERRSVEMLVVRSR